MESDSQFVDGIVGPHEIGVMVSIFLFGLVTIQVFTYFQQYPEDSRGTKMLVGFVWTLLFAHTIVSAFAVYRRTVKNYGRFVDLEKYPEGMCGAFALSGVIGGTVQSYFAYRLWKLSGNSAIVLTCWALCMVRMGTIFCISITTCRAKTVKEYMANWAWLVITSLSISTFVDVVVAVSLSYSLWNRRNDVFKHARRVVDRLIAWTIHTGALTSITSALMLALYVGINNFAWMAPYQAISGLFANYLLASLNARQSLRSDMNRRPTFVDMTVMHNSPLPSLPRPPSLQSITFEVNVGLLDYGRGSLVTSKNTDLEHGALTTTTTTH